MTVDTLHNTFLDIHSAPNSIQYAAGNTVIVRLEHFNRFAGTKITDYFIILYGT